VHDLQNWSLRLDLLPRQPLQPIRSHHRQDERDQAELGLEQQKQTIAYEIADAIRVSRERRKEDKCLGRPGSFRKKRVRRDAQVQLARQEAMAARLSAAIDERPDERISASSTTRLPWRLEKAMGTTIKSLGLKFRDHVF
jgi:hypothetical protein